MRYALIRCTQLFGHIFISSGNCTMSKIILPLSTIPKLSYDLTSFEISLCMCLNLIFLSLGKVMLCACYVYLHRAGKFRLWGYDIPTKGSSTLFYLTICCLVSDLSDFQMEAIMLLLLYSRILPFSFCIEIFYPFYSYKFDLFLAILCKGQQFWVSTIMVLLP